MIISLDIETTGLDVYHGNRPFLVAICNQIWEWDVDPLTRIPKVPKGDVEEILDRIDQADEVILQNSKFDINGLVAWDKRFLKVFNWSKIRDTIVSDHLLASGELHNLTDMSTRWLGIDISPYEEALQVAGNQARAKARSKHKDWKIATEDEPSLPSAKGAKLWKMDMWLPRAIATAEKYQANHPWWTLCAKYTSVDSGVLLPIHTKHMEELERRGLMGLYFESLKLIPVIAQMERRGISCNMMRKEELYTEYEQDTARAEKICVNLSGGNLTKLPKAGGRSKALEETLFGHFGLNSTKLTRKAKNPSMDKDVVEYWRLTLPPRSKALTFVTHLSNFRQRRTAMGAMTGYERAGIWIDDTWVILHSSLNPNGSNTLRGTSNNPNGQNISKKPGFNMRYLFGPRPGREWWAIDYSNIELRIPAYEAGETEMIELFENPDEPPYFGGVHLLMFDTLHPEKFAKYGARVKDKDVYGSTWYQWTKNGDFAVQYGSVEASGKADAAYHVPGAFKLIKGRFKKIHGPGGLNERCIAFAQEHGYIETVADKKFGIGYPLECEFNNWGKVKPTVPLNYRTQGTAMWCMRRAMVRCANYLKTLGPNYWMVLQVHDELLFDFPAGTGPEPYKTNLPKVKHLKKLMEQSGDDVGIPLRADIAYHPVSYDVEVKIAC